MIDIEQLHNVIEGRSFRRGCGRTTAMLVQAIQSALVMTEIEHSQFAIIGNDDKETNHLCLEAISIIQHNADIAGDGPVRISRNRRKIILRNQYDSSLFFIPRDSIMRHNMAGLTFTNIFMDHHIYPSLTEDEETKLFLGSVLF